MRRCLIPQESSDRQLLTSSSCSTRTPRSAIRTIPTVTQRAKSAVRSAHTRGSIYQEAVHRTAPACVTRASRALPRSCFASFRCKFVAQGCGAAPNSAPTVSAVSTRLYLRSPCSNHRCVLRRGTTSHTPHELLCARRAADHGAPSHVERAQRIVRVHTRACVWACHSLAKLSLHAHARAFSGRRCT